MLIMQNCVATKTCLLTWKDAHDILGWLGVQIHPTFKNYEYVLSVGGRVTQAIFSLSAHGYFLLCLHGHALIRYQNRQTYIDERGA